MRVLLIASEPGLDSMEKHTLMALKNLGHEVAHFNTQKLTGFGKRMNNAAFSLLRLTIREPERISEKSLLRLVGETAPDLIIVLLGNNVSPKTILAIRKQWQGKIVAWCQDQLVNLGRQYLIGAEYDHIFVKDHYVMDFLSNMVGHPSVHYLPEACNPAIHRTLVASPEEARDYACDISTFGSLYYYRQAVLENLLAYDLKVWGPVPDWLVRKLGMRHLGRSIFEDEKCKAISVTKITLNTLHYGEIASLNCRAFEVAGCGGFQLMSYSSAAAAHFVPDQELVMYRNRKEMIEKIDHYLARPEKRRAIAAAGQARAHHEHTYEKRLSQLIETSTA